LPIKKRNCFKWFKRQLLWNIKRKKIQ
jgi:hypothetical protein